jgi:hypothetical protein
MKPTANTRNQQIPAADTLWTTADLAQFLGCSERQVYVLRKRGLPTLFIGGLILNGKMENRCSGEASSEMQGNGEHCRAGEGLPAG